MDSDLLIFLDYQLFTPPKDPVYHPKHSLPQQGQVSGLREQSAGVEMVLNWASWLPSSKKLFV